SLSEITEENLLYQVPCPSCNFLFIDLRRHPTSTLFPYTTLFRSFLPSLPEQWAPLRRQASTGSSTRCSRPTRKLILFDHPDLHRSEEHTSELQSRSDLVCRLLLEKKKKSLHLSHTNSRTVDVLVL